MNEMGPSQIAETIYRIQQIDSSIISLHREIEGLSRKHRLEDLASELASAREVLTDKERKLSDIERKQHKLDGELELLVEKLKGEEEKLYSGTIMNPKELSAIQAEILSLRKKKDDMETEELLMLEEIDSLKREIAQLSATVRKVEESEERARGEYEAELKEMESRIEALVRERDELKGALGDPELVRTYEKLLKEKDGLAVVKMEGGRNCGGCRIEFTRTQIDRFQHEEGIFRCEYCRRILVK